MPIYEYKSKTESHCKLCKATFEMRQHLDDEPLTECPRCGREVERLFSKNFIAVIDTLSTEETFATYTEKEANDKGLEGGFASDEVWD